MQVTREAQESSHSNLALDRTEDIPVSFVNSAVIVVSRPYLRQGQPPRPDWAPYDPRAAPRMRRLPAFEFEQLVPSTTHCAVPHRPRADRNRSTGQKGPS